MLVAKLTSDWNKNPPRKLFNQTQPFGACVVAPQNGFPILIEKIT
jgi:hypothetical protein